MVKRKSSNYFWFVITPAVFLAIAVSIIYIDAGLAKRVMAFLLSIKTLHRATENIPDVLVYLVAGATVLMWIVYIYRYINKKLDAETSFLRLAASTLPVTYFIKVFLQFTFGRTSPRNWLISHEPLLFKFFNEHGGSFPSGHMTVFVAFGTAVFIYFPKYRKLVVALLVILGFALIGTDYHFLSDVIAGAYLGFVITYTLWRLYEK